MHNFSNVADSYVHYSCAYDSYVHYSYAYDSYCVVHKMYVSDSCAYSSSPNTPGELKACTRTAQRSLCPPETISAQSSMVKDRYVRQKLYHLKVQRTNVAMSARNYISSKFKGQMSLCRVTHPCRVDLGTQNKK